MDRIGRWMHVMLFSLALCLGTVDVLAQDLPAAESAAPPQMPTPEAALAIYGKLAGGASERIDAAVQAQAKAFEGLATAEAVGRAYAFVHDRIEFVPVFGAQKGPRGALIDGNGTSLDQVRLLAQLLRALNVKVTYRIGVATLSGDQFAGWFGIRAAEAARRALAAGGFAAQVTENGAGAVAKVDMMHVWLEAELGGRPYVLDPSFKAHEAPAPVDLAMAMGFQPGALLSAGLSGASVSAEEVHGINSGAIRTHLQSRSAALATWLETNRPDASLEEVLGRRTIVAQAGGLPPTLPYTVKGSASWAGEVPDMLRTRLTLRVGYGPSTQWMERTLYLDEIYGGELLLRNLSLPRTCVGGAGGTNCSTDHPHVQVQLDGAVLVDWTDSSVPMSQRNRYKVQLGIDHPYAADNGQYMDRTFSREGVDLWTPALVIAGAGEMRDGLKQAMERARYADTEDAQAPLLGTCAPPYPAFCPQASEPVDPPARQNLEKSKGQLAATWMVQYSRMAWMVEGLTATTHQLHHMLGLVTTEVEGDRYGMVSDTALKIDAEPTYSVSGADAARAGAAAQTIANAASALEAHTMREVGGQPDAISAITRMGWLAQNQPASPVRLYDPARRPDYGLLSTDLVDQYLAAGYRVMSIAADLGPGHPGTRGSKTGYVRTLGSFLVAVKPGKAGYVNLGLGRASKGGGGQTHTPEVAGLDLKDASADAVRQQAERWSLGTKVDLRTGALTYSPAADLVTGSGSFPYALTFQRHFASSAVSPERPGWSESLSVRGAFRSSGMEGLGTTSAVYAAPALAWLMGLTDVLSAPVGQTADFPAVYVGSVAGAWWVERQYNNVATVTQGPAVSLFVRRADGTFGRRVGEGESLTQVGDFTLLDDGMGWLRLQHTGMSLQRRLADGSVQVLPFRAAGGNEGDKCGVGSASASVVCRGPGHVFRIESWTWPSGMTLTYGYLEDRSALLAMQPTNLLSSVSNNLGRSLTLAYERGPSFNGQPGILLPYDGFRVASVTDGTGRAAQFDGGGKATNPMAEMLRAEIYPDPEHGLINHVMTIRLPEDGPAGVPSALVGFDARGLVATLTDKSGWVTHYRPGRHGSSRAADGSVSAVEHDINDRAVKSLDPLNRVSLTRHDGLGRAVWAQDAAGGVVESRYDGRGNLLTRRRVARPGPALAATVESQTWHSVWNKPLTQTDARGAVTTYAYHATTGALLQVTAPAAADAGQPGSPLVSGVTRLEDYDGFGRVRRVVLPDGSVNLYDYAPDREMMVKATVDAGRLGLTTVLDWTAAGDLRQMTDPRGHVWTAGYDAARRRRDLSLPDGGRVEWQRNGNGWVTHIRRAVENPVVTWADTGFVYDDNGRLHRVTDPLGRVTETLYDAVGRPRRTTDPLGRITETLYDAAGQVEAEKAAVGTDLQQESARYTYYADGQVATITDPRGHVLRHEYDGFGRLSRLVHPDGPAELHAYDANDNLTGFTQRDGTVSTTAYDALNRPVSVTRPGLPVAGYGYDRMGRVVVEKAGATVVRSHVYDTAGRRLTSTITLPRPATGVTGAAPSVVMGFTHDAAGNRTGATWSGGTVTWDYDALNRVSAVKLGGETVTSHLYDLLGRRTDTVRGLAASHYGYDLGDQLTDLSHSWSGGSLAATYHYDAAGQLDWETMGNPAFLWEPAPTLSKTTTYDPATPINALTKVDGVAQIHDARGNRTGAGGRTWRYDSRNMLAGSNAPGMAVSYGYYPEGGRAWKQVNGVTTLYLELDGVEWGTYDASGSLKERTIRASGTGGAVVAVHSPAGGLIRLLPNRQGSVIGWLRPDGKLGGAYTYDAYGNSPQAGAGGPAFRYAGMRYDAETGLYHTPNRAYDPQDGRWMQLDPIGVKDGLNRYAYVRNSPVNGVDPTGLQVALACGPAAPGCAVAETAVKVAPVVANAAAVVVGAVAGYAVAEMGSAIHENMAKNMAGGASAIEGVEGDVEQGPGQEVLDVGNSNPYKGPVDGPVTVVDTHGNAIPVDTGEHIQSSPNGDYQQVKDAQNTPTGVRLDRGGHPNQKNPAARGPHGHRPGVTTPDGNPHLPIRTK